MANRPSQLCRCCDGKGWVYSTPKLVAPCIVCGGRGAVTICLARILKWRPIIHRKRPDRPQQLILGG